MPVVADRSEEDLLFAELVATEVRLLRKDPSLEQWTHELRAIASKRKRANWRPAAFRQFDRMVLYRLLSVATETNIGTDEIDRIWTAYHRLRPRIDERISVACLLARHRPKQPVAAWMRRVRARVQAVLRAVRKTRISRVRLRKVQDNLMTALKQGGND